MKAGNRAKTWSMCAKCAELDGRIAFLRRMVDQLEDPDGIEAAGKLIKMMEAMKDAFHPAPIK